MAITLASLRQREKPKPPIIVLYGPGGVGKTTMAAGAPGAVLMAVEDGIGRLDIPHWPIASYGDAMAGIAALYSDEHDLKTLVIDSIDWLEPMIWAEACRQEGWASIEQPGYGKGYVKAAEVWRSFIDGIRALRDERGMTIVLIAHQAIKRFEDPTSDPYDRYVLKLHDKASALIVEAADIVGFLSYRVSIKTVDTGFNQKATRGVGGGLRVLYLEERPGFIAKSRFTAPASIDIPNSSDPTKLWQAFESVITPKADK